MFSWCSTLVVPHSCLCSPLFTSYSFRGFLFSAWTRGFPRLWRQQHTQEYGAWKCFMSGSIGGFFWATFLERCAEEREDPPICLVSRCGVSRPRQQHSLCLSVNTNQEHQTGCVINPLDLPHVSISERAHRKRLKKDEPSVSRIQVDLSGN